MRSEGAPTTMETGLPTMSGRGDAVYAALRQAVVEQALSPGTKLPEDGLGAHFGVSRTIVRAALQRLAGDGLVEMKAKRTATVARPSLAEARSVFEVRRCLEREVIRLVIARWKAEFGTALERHVRLEEAAAKEPDTTATIRLAAEFHIKLAAMAGNRLLSRYVGEVVSRCSLILAVFGRPHRSECAIGEHREVIAALKAGDVEAAVAAMDHHVALVEQRGVAGDAEAPTDMATVLGRYWPAGADRTIPKPKTAS